MTQSFIPDFLFILISGDWTTSRRTTNSEAAIKSTSFIVQFPYS